VEDKIEGERTEVEESCDESPELFDIRSALQLEEQTDYLVLQKHSSERVEEVEWTYNLRLNESARYYDSRRPESCDRRQFHEPLFEREPALSTHDLIHVELFRSVDEKGSCVITDTED